METTNFTFEGPDFLMDSLKQTWIKVTLSYGVKGRCWYDISFLCFSFYSDKSLVYTKVLLRAGCVFEGINKVLWVLDKQLMLEWIEKGINLWAGCHWLSQDLFNGDKIFQWCHFLGPHQLHPHVLNVLGMQMRSRLHMQSSHVPHATWLINKQINHMAN